LRKKEIFWLIGTTILVLILNALIFGIDGLKSDSTLDINVHDTYFVIANFHFIFLLGVLVFFGIYLIRTLRRNFKNLTANLILMISTILLIIILNGISTIVDNFIQQTSGWTIYPPLSAGDGIKQIEQEIKPKENSFRILSSVLFYTQILLLIFLTYCGFKTGLNYKRNE
jgi:heme/copper-type cytochrome/quinol oxidase subunit 1